MGPSSTNTLSVAAATEEQTSKGKILAEYREIAELMADEPYTAFFRKFDYISMLRLITLQTRLSEDEEELKRLGLIFSVARPNNDDDGTNGNAVSYTPEQLHILDRCEVSLRDYREWHLQGYLSAL